MPRDIIAAIAAGMTRLSGVGLGQRQRRYERVLATDDYEIWVICWPPGGELDLHDHGGSAGAVCVVTGALEETTIVAGAPVVRRLDAGGTISFDADHVQAVANPDADVAVSVHVYSPPLGEMGFYDRGAGEAPTRRTR